MTSDRQTLVLLLAGALISAAVGLLGSLVGINWTGVAVLGIAGVLLLLYGFWGFRLERWLNHEYRQRACQVGILNDMGWDSEYTEYSSWTAVSPQGWQETIDRTARSCPAELRARLINRNAVFDRYAAILNPYGGVYPEGDLRSQTTLAKIVNYVANGGLFVNVADIPCYYAYSPRLGRRVDTTPANWQTVVTPEGAVSAIPLRFFARTPLMETLGLTVARIQQSEPLFRWKVEGASALGEAVEGVSEIEVERVVSVERNVQPVIRDLKYGGRDVTPFFAELYDNGRFLMSLVPLDRPQNQSMQDAIAKALVQLVTEGSAARGAR